MQFNKLRVPDQWNTYFTKYPQGFTILEALMDWVSQVNKMSTNLNEWNDYLQEFVETFEKELQGKVTDTLKEWQESGFLGDIINEALLKDLTDIKYSMFDFDITKARNTFIFDFEMKFETVNQGLVIDEKKHNIYASQVNTITGDNGIEGYRINRTDPAGKLLDTMLVRRGGHGTSFGIEYEGAFPYIWGETSSMNEDGTKKESYISRFPYIPGTEITGESPGVTNYFIHSAGMTATPFVDNKNELLAIRRTMGENPRATKVDIHNINSVKGGNLIPIYTFEFTEEMNNLPMQGLTLDGNLLYITFGMSINEYRLFQVDIITGEILHTLNGSDLNISRTEGGFLEPEGIYLYTDPNTGKKILFQVLVTDIANRRRYNLYALASSDIVSTFQGYASQKSQQIQLLRNDGNAFRKYELNGQGRLSDILDPGSYYFNSSEMNAFSDHPAPSSGGYWLHVSAKDTGATVRQLLVRNTTATNPNILHRVVNPTTGISSVWSGQSNKVVDFQNDFTNQYASAEHLQYHKEGNTLHILGIIKNEGTESTGIIFNLPVGFRPAYRQAVPIIVFGGIGELTVHTNGDVEISGFRDQISETTYMHCNATFSLL